MQRMASILKTETGVCYICHKRTETALHHIYYGPLRKISDRNGFWCFLCPECHQYGDKAVHRNHKVDIALKKHTQKVFERTHTRQEFMQLIHKNYMEE